MKDFLGFDLHVGDPVIMKRPGSSGFVRGTVLKLNAKQVRVEYGPSKVKTSKYPDELIREIITPENIELVKFTMKVS